MTDRSSSESKALKSALDNSQSLLVMVQHLGTAMGEPGITSIDWYNECLTKMLADQISENRASLQPATPTAGEPAFRIEDAPAAWLAEYDGHASVTVNRDTMLQWRDTLGRKITPLYAIEATGGDAVAAYKKQKADLFSKSIDALSADYCVSGDAVAGDAKAQGESK
jgi:hypothetical protein